MFNVTVDKVERPVPVTVMRLNGELDASNYEALIAQTNELYDGGTRNLLLDLDYLDFVSSSGLVALHRMALIMRGEAPESADEGWGAISAITRDLVKAREPEVHLKLLKPQPLVSKVLATSGFSDIFPIFTDEAGAIASFA